MAVLSPILMYIIYFTDLPDLIAPRAEYVRLKNGKEFKDVPIRYPSNEKVIINGEHYMIYDIDSLVR